MIIQFVKSNVPLGVCARCGMSCPGTWLCGPCVTARLNWSRFLCALLLAVVITAMVLASYGILVP